MANRQPIALTKEERAERRKQEQQLTEQAVAQLRCSAGLAALADRARLGRTAALQPHYLGSRCRRRLLIGAGCR
jgi:hypothetical protein